MTPVWRSPYNQKMIQFFLKLLQVAGGDLNVSKCTYFTVFRHWKGGRATLFRMHYSHPTMTITYPSSGELKHITRKNPNESHRALGWTTTTDGKSTSQFIVSRDKANIFAGGILQSRMQCYYATTTYNLTYIASIGYTLAANRFYINQCKIIHSPIICATLNRMGINRNVSRHIISDPKHMGGMALRHLHTLQGIHCIQCPIGHITNKDGVTKLKTICIEAIQLEVGTFEPFLCLPFSFHGSILVSRSWINEIWSFNELFSGTIIISNTWLPHPQSDHDQALMSLAILFSQNKGKLRQINICHIYLDGISTADTCNFDGTRIT
jgi:hypothetical protein